MRLPTLSQDIYEDIWLGANVEQYSSYIHADIARELKCPQGRGRIRPYGDAWIVQRLDGSYLLREQ